MAGKKASSESKVTLYSKELEESRSFGIEHANRIFKLKNHGWEIKDNNYELNENGIITKRNHSKAERAEEQGTA